MATNINLHSSKIHGSLKVDLKAVSSAIHKNSGEVGAIGKSIGNVIQDYTKKIHNNLEDWDQLSGELSDLLKFAKPFSQLLITLKKTSMGTDNVTISGTEAGLFLELGHLLGDSFSDSVHIEKITFKDNHGTNYTIPAGDLTWALSVMSVPPKDVSDLKVVLSPSDAKEAEQGYSKSGNDLLSLSGISQKVEGLKHKQTKDLFKVMALTNAKKSNENSLSSIIQLLRSLANTAINNIQ